MPVARVLCGASRCGAALSGIFPRLRVSGSRRRARLHNVVGCVMLGRILEGMALYSTTLNWTILVLDYTGLDYTVLDYTVLDYTVLDYTGLDCTILGYTGLDFTVLHYIVPDSSILHQTSNILAFPAPYCITQGALVARALLRTWPLCPRASHCAYPHNCSALQCTAVYCTALQFTAVYCAALPCTVQCNILQQCTVLLCTARGRLFPRLHPVGSCCSGRSGHQEENSN